LYNLTKIQLFHWNASEAAQYIDFLVSAGYEVIYNASANPMDDLRRMRQDPPAAVVIDLSRLPSHGREVGMAIRSQKTTRYIPLVFVSGEAEKVTRVRSMLPDAVYTTWEGIRQALKEAIEHPPAEPIATTSAMDAYAGQPLTKKLGIKSGMTIGLVNTPSGFIEALGPLPEKVCLHEQPEEHCDLLIWFVRSRNELEQGMPQVVARNDYRGVWIAWPKKTSGVSSDLTQPVVRKAGLAVELVDYKVCAIDATWSGLLFSRRKE
jgi:CheY-like chemotaxis protein